MCVFGSCLGMVSGVGNINIVRFQRQRGCHASESPMFKTSISEARGTNSSGPYNFAAFPSYLCKKTLNSLKNAHSIFCRHPFFIHSLASAGNVSTTPIGQSSCAEKNNTLSLASNSCVLRIVSSASSSVCVITGSKKGSLTARLR